MADQPQIEKEKVLVEWQANSRPFKKFKKEFYINLGAVAVLFGLILFIIEGLMPAILVASIYFIFYVLTTIEPPKINYQITTYGIKVEDDRVDWVFMGRYWFAKRFNDEVLVVETAEAPWKLELVIDSAKKKEIDDSISQYLYLNDAPPNYLDKATNWVSSKLKI